ncbi:MAG: glycine--tRNA ligase subunit beta [Spirochaetes bacterium]|jgi:glycyl-tRNA synthetase beta chain|nr:glycine--tRNA ligase subunit beta [Spirochaetota bacterium]
MLQNANFLCEIGTEEIPAAYLPPAIAFSKKFFGERLKNERIGFGQIEVWATPRRLVIIASNVSPAQSEEEVELKGPSVKAAYDAEGKPTKALQGFLKGNSIEEGQVVSRSTEKGEYLFATKALVSNKSGKILPGIIEDLVKSLPFPKKMRWSDLKLSFPRPIAYFCVLFNDVVVPFELSGISSSNMVRGHYIRYNQMLEVKSIAGYQDILRENGVLVDHNERRDLIRGELEKTAGSLGGELVFDEELLETVTFLAESPFVLVCDFRREFLSIPDIVLITEMKEHQKYFAVRGADGVLLPNFLVVSNNPPSAYVKAGNERVITARFNDARFFFDEDRKSKLADKVDSLKNVLFHKELGSIYDKVERMRFISAHLAGVLGLDAEIAQRIDRAAYLCKADLNTAMVFEFTSLQGKMGRIYALLDGEDQAVADAIDDHYRPRSQDDPMPEGVVSRVLSLAEKLDNLLGSYSVGNIPKGSQDPYALRRQAGAVVEMAVEGEMSIDMRALLEHCAVKYLNGDALIKPILAFIGGRANTLFAEKGFRYDVIDACLSIDYHNYLEQFRRAHSLHEFRGREGFSEMLLSFKRMNNIVAAFRQKQPDYRLVFKPALVGEEAERGLFEFFNSRGDTISELIRSDSYRELFGLLIEGKSAIDTFFDEVMVMSDDITVRDNRLALLETILEPFKGLLDFTKISE